MFSHWDGRACHLAVRCSHNFIDSISVLRHHALLLRLVRIVRFSAVSHLHVISIDSRAPSNRCCYRWEKKNTFTKWVWHYCVHSFRFFQSRVRRSRRKAAAAGKWWIREKGHRSHKLCLTAYHFRLLRSFVGFACAPAAFVVNVTQFFHLCHCLYWFLIFCRLLLSAAKNW